MEPATYVIATMDTKGAEAAYVAERLREAGIAVRKVDVGTLSNPTIEPDVSRDDVLRFAHISDQEIDSRDRGQAIAHMGEALRSYLLAEFAAGRVKGVIGLGGSGGTSLITTAMRALPIGLPKLMVSTVASGDVAPYVDCSDIFMLYSVVDIAGLNAVSEPILANAAAAMAGMARRPPVSGHARKAIGMTMFGVTTPCVTRVRRTLERKGFDALVFHATGAGGRAMERLVESGLISGVLDITTTEVADEIVGGVFPCGSERFDRLIAAGVPLVVSFGAIDMVNFGAIATVPARFGDRLLHVHNAQVTLMRTSVEENRQVGEWIADKLNASKTPIRVLIPEGGVSLLDRPGQPFYDPEADRAAFEAFENRFQATPLKRLIRLPYDINAPEFADALVSNFLDILQASGDE
ncbi:UPF0261 family protein [bacterium]|nr:UPF0261 family protein [bacterium]